jgi:hypothetical protein
LDFKSLPIKAPRFTDKPLNPVLCAIKVNFSMLKDKINGTNVTFFTEQSFRKQSENFINDQKTSKHHASNVKATDKQRRQNGTIQFLFQVEFKN